MDWYVLLSWIVYKYVSALISTKGFIFTFICYVSIFPWFVTLPSAVTRYVGIFHWFVLGMYLCHEMRQLCYNSFIYLSVYLSVAIITSALLCTFRQKPMLFHILTIVLLFLCNSSFINIYYNTVLTYFISSLYLHLSLLPFIPPSPNATTATKHTGVHYRRLWVLDNPRLCPR